MKRQDDWVYYAHRAETEHNAAMRATDKRVQHAHRAMAAIYISRLRACSDSPREQHIRPLEDALIQM